MNFFYKKRNYIIAAVLLLSFFVFFPHCSAAPEDLNAAEKFVGGTVKNLIDLTVGFMAEMTTAALGWLTSKIVAMIIGFANYSDFVNNEQVKDGWTVVRDICNMFFILILLFIAFAVILRMESYSIKKSLPKLLLMAVLINFSRTICGILIDFSQIVMLTFIGPITEGQGNFHNVLRINTFLNSVASAKYENMDLTNTVIYYVIAVIFMLIVTVVLLAVLIAFVMRIVMFWIYIVLSPLAFLLAAFPGGQRYAGQYWGEFTKYLLNGPVLAFFLWLSLYTLGNLEVKQIGDAFSDAPVEILTGENLSRFIMAIGMLVGGLTISAQIGGMGSSWGSGMVSNIKNKGIGVAKRVSGYDAVADRTKAYFATRKSARDERIRESTAQIAGNIGKAKKFVAQSVNIPAQKIWGAWGGNKAKQLEKEINDDSKQLGNYKDIKYIQGMGNFNVGKTKYEKRGEVWVNEGNGARLNAENAQKLLVDNKQAEINAKVAEKTRHNNRQETMNKAGKIGLGTLGGFTGLMLGGVPGMLYGAAAGRYGATSIGSDIKNAGSTDLDMLSSFQSKKVSAEKEDIQNKEDEEVKSITEDPTMSIFKRMAASLELIARKKTDVKGIENMRRDIASKFESKTKAVFENTVSKNYPGATKIFDFQGPNADSNKRKVREAFEQGSFSLADLDSDTLLKCGQQIGEGLKFPTFKRQYDALSDAKKTVVVQSLKDSGHEDAKAKIARIKSIKEAFGNDMDGRRKFTQNLNIKVIQEILNEGNAEQRSDFRETVVTPEGKLDREALSPDVYERLIDENVAASKAILSALGVVTKKAEKNSKTAREAEDEMYTV